MGRPARWGLFGFLVLACVLSFLELRPYAFAQKVEGAGRKDYELRLFRAGRAFEGIRFRVSTGETWVMAGDRYEKVAEADAVPAGDYDVSLLADEDHSVVFRLDRFSGTTWLLKDRK